MLLRAFRGRVYALDWSIRTISTSPSLLSRGRKHNAFNPSRVVNDIFRECSLRLEDNSFFLGNKLASVSNPSELTRVVSSEGTNLIDVDKWARAATAPDIPTSIQWLNVSGIKFDALDFSQESEDSKADVDHMPTWLVLHLLRHKVKTAQDASIAMDLTFHHLPYAPLPTQPALLVMLAYRLTNHHMYSKLFAVISTFFKLPDTEANRYFNLLLLALSTARHSKQAADLAARVIEVMGERKVRVEPAVFDALLRQSFLSLRLALRARTQMQLQGFVPTRKHLTALIRVMCQHHHRKDAGRLLNAIRQQQLISREKTVTHGTHISGSSPPSRVPTFTQDTRFYMSSFKSFPKLYGFLDRMSRAEAKMQAARVKLGVVPCVASPVKQDSEEEDTLDSVSDIEDDDVPANPPDSGQIPVTQSTPLTLEAVIPSAESHVQFSVKDWTAILHVASRDRTISARNLFKIFQQGKAKLEFNFPMYTYAVTIRGLLLKNSPKRATLLWKESQDEGLPLDTLSLAIGINVLTLNDGEDAAFELIENIYADQVYRFGRSGRSHRSSSERIPFVNSYTLQMYMKALLRAGRPDIVFELWEHMELLYGIVPDTFTLNVLLRTARWAKKLEEKSIRAYLVRSGYGGGVKRPELPSLYDSHASSPHIHPRNIAAERIRILSQKRKRVVLGLWGDESAAMRCIRLLRDIFLTNWPDLKAVRPPVRALRRIMGSGPDGELSTNEIWSPKTSTHLYRYSRIVPTDATFRLYIHLLAAEDLKAEIPLALAWMRELGIQPTVATLATAMVYWGEVSMDAPLIEAAKGGSTKSPYTTLRNWIWEWVGDRVAPSDVNVGSAMRNIDVFRRVYYGKRK
ncbi:hypothetical protein ABKN59_002977 [Abortiporus biennis]